jgi:hypothetical protein
VGIAGTRRRRSASWPTSCRCGRRPEPSSSAAGWVGQARHPWLVDPGRLVASRRAAVAARWKPANGIWVHTILAPGGWQRRISPPASLLVTRGWLRSATCGRPRCATRGRVGRIRGAICGG